MSKCKYVRVLTTVKGAYRNRGIGHNFHDMSEAADFLDRLRNVNIKKVTRITIKPTEVDYSDPGRAAKDLDDYSTEIW